MSKRIKFRAVIDGETYENCWVNDHMEVLQYDHKMECDVIIGEVKGVMAGDSEYLPAVEQLFIFMGEYDEQGNEIYKLV